jgi:hypothetical protein
VGLSQQELATGQQQGEQLSLLCTCGKKPIELKNLGRCRSCYDRQYHSLRFFGGMREEVLKRDRFRCRACGTRSRLVVHHRDRGNEPNVLITPCIRCHVRIHRSSGLRYWLSGKLLRLWRELHSRDPVQLQLMFKSAAKKENSEGSVKQASAAMMSLSLFAERSRD